MTVAPGIVTFTLSGSLAIGSGRVWTEGDLSHALTDRVAAIVYDEAGNNALVELLTALSDTDFDGSSIQQIFAAPPDVENWRVGEALAECYLVDHRACFFPWPDDRDQRKAGSSLPGADLVGFHPHNDSDRFAFGEVKTSSEVAYPPKLMYGSCGLKAQMEDLRDRREVRHELLKYLGYRAPGTTWQPRFKSAASRYLKNDSDVQVFGVLIRDVSPHVDDLKARVTRLDDGCPAAMNIELLALYLPSASISSLSKRAKSVRSGGTP